VIVTRKIAKPLDAETAKAIVADLSRWYLHVPAADDILDAIGIHQRTGNGCLSGPHQDASRIRSALLPHLVCRAGPGPAGRTAPASGALHPRSAGSSPPTVSRCFSVAARFYRTCVIDGLLEHSPAEHVRRPSISAYFRRITDPRVHLPVIRGPAHHSPVRRSLRLRPRGHARASRLADLRGHRRRHADMGEEHGHRVLRVCGKGTKVLLVLLPPAVGRAIDQAIGARTAGLSC
jgi:hypothetical protein